MTLGRLIPVYREELEKATLMVSFLKGYQIPAIMIPDVTSKPLKDPAAHGVKSQYSLNVILVDEEYEQEAQALVDDYLSKDGKD